MSDLISRKAALEALADYIHMIDKSKGKGRLTSGACMEAAKSVLGEDEIPAAQPEIIRCKDCKHGSPNGKYGCRAYHYRRYETHDMEPDDFCSRAERRTDG